ncbi:MAG: OmpA family protein [Myxococcota bacterium]
MAQFQFVGWDGLRYVLVSSPEEASAPGYTRVEHGLLHSILAEAFADPAFVRRIRAECPGTLPADLTPPLSARDTEELWQRLSQRGFVLRAQPRLSGTVFSPPPAVDLSELAPEPEPTPAEDLQDLHFEIQFTDEFGDPLTGQAFDVLFNYEGQTERVTTDGNGLAVLDIRGGTTTAWVRLADQDGVNSIRESAVDLWTNAPRVTDREADVLIEGQDVTVVFLETDPADDQRLIGRQFRVSHNETERVSIQPYVRLAELVGLFFETNKCFVLPTAMPSLTAMTAWYDEHPGADLLLVGHTDTSGDDEYNETLSLERADAMAAYLKDDIDAWMEWYDSGVSYEKRWGRNEDGLMIESLAASRGLVLGANHTRSYQQWHNALAADARAANWEQLDDDGSIGPLTRAQLVGDYMNHDETTLPEDVELTTHGCGEYFPLDRSGEEIDEDAADGQHDQGDRRVELFFFDGRTGILPAPGGDISARGSAEYPEWRARAKEVRRFESRKVHVIIDMEIDNPFEYQLRAGGLVFRGDLDANSTIEHDVPLGDGAADLHVQDTETQGVFAWDISLGPLGEIETFVGARERLRNLAIDFRAPADEEDELTREAVARFQSLEGFDPTGDYDEDTQNALAAAHDAP